METENLPTKVANDTPAPTKGATQEARALAVLSAAGGELVPWQEVVRAVYPQAGDNLDPHRGPLRDVLRRLRDRGVSIETIPHHGFALKGVAPKAIPQGEAGRSKPAPKQDGLAMRPCKPGCGKMFKPDHKWNRRCLDCNQKAREMSGDITLGYW
jgi:hypothetical protein